MICWIFNHYINKPDTPGGSRHYTLAKRLAFRGHTVVLFGAQPERSKGFFTIEKVNGFTIVWFNISKYYGKSVKRIINMFAYSVLALFVVTRRKNLRLMRPDVILGSSVHLFGAYAAYIISCFYKVPFIFEVRDLWPQTLIDMGTLSEESLLTKILQGIERQLYEKSVVIVTLLPFAFEYICERYRINPEKIKWVPNGVDIEMFPEQEWPKTDSVTITYVGSYGIANALDTIIKAAAILESEGLNDIRFRFIGDGPLKKSLIDKIKTLGLRNIRFYNPVPKKNLYTVARDTHAFIVNMKDIPLYRYGISLNKIFDYMAMARPVIIGCSARNNPIKEASAGISVDADSPLQMAKAVRSLRGYTKDTLLSMGNNGRTFVKRNNEYSVLSDTLEEWLSEALSYLDKEK